MNKIIILLAFTLTLNTFAQDLKLPFKFGNVPTSEFNLKYYAKDSSANAVVLYEKALAKVILVHDYLRLETTYYHKIKIFNKNSAKYASISIPIYNSLKSQERVIDIKGITHNYNNGIDVKMYLNKKNIFTNKVNDHWKEVTFTLPNIKNGSIIEYSYKLQSPFFYNFTGWDFQGDIPKKYSELHSLIPGNWKYNKKLIGFKKLDVNESKIKYGCFSFTGLERAADCEDLTYVMKDVPAFKKEPYLTAKKNYLSHITFELAEYQSFKGRTSKYTTSWKEVDRNFRNDLAIGRQLKKIDYTKKLLPADLFTEKDTLKRAIKVYHYIQNYFKWNGKYHVTKSVDFKKAFKSKTGNATEINIALCNALNAVGIPTKLMLVSTRKNGLPTYVHPVLNDFNYAIAAAEIGGVFYQLDASYKLMPFAMLPFKALNSYGRLMDFKNGSYWQDIKAPRNVQSTTINLKFSEGVLNGLMRIKSNAFTAYNKRDDLVNKGEEKYKEAFENKSEMNELVIDSYRVRNLENLEKMLVEDFKISFENESDNEDLLIINPYLDKYTTNPFKLNERTYPIDFGYTQSENYHFVFSVPEGYEISSVPKNKILTLENNTASLNGKTTINGRQIIIDYKLSSSNKCNS